MYDHYISLGVNCEVSFQIQRITPKFDSYLFSWAGLTTLEKLLSCLKNVESICSGELEPRPEKKNMFRCANTDSLWHGRLVFTEAMDQHGNIDPIALQNAKDEMATRISHLRKKFINKVQDDTKKLLILKVRPDDEIDAQATSTEIFDCITNQHGGRNIHLLVLQKGFAGARRHNSGNIFYRYIKRLAPPGDPTDSHHKSWDALFNEFPLKTRFVSALVQNDENVAKIISHYGNIHKAMQVAVERLARSLPRT